MIEILEPGPLALIEDLGRLGYTDLGVCRSGAFDTAAHRLANRLVGNSEAAATIEITLGGVAFRLRDAATIALTGARCPLDSDRPVDWNAAYTLPAGTTVRLGAPPTELRSYLAVRGGIDAARTLGSRSADTLSGLGPEPLRAEQVLPIGDDVAGMPASGLAPIWQPSESVGIVAGPRADWFSPAALDVLRRSSWTAQASSNRVGIRLGGPALERTVTRELPSEPTLPGAIQVPPDGQPIVLGPDAPVTGGYPVIAVVVRGDLSRLGQLRPGSELQFILAKYAN
jgi:biotin-dependent carboxylase-like uncharacterized protein